MNRSAQASDRAAPAEGVRGRSSTAPGTAAGFLFQFERALLRLAEADTYESEVGIETLDDVAVREGSELVLLEQNKHTIAAETLSDRSYSLWHTLSLWSKNGRPMAQLCLVTNRALAGAFLVGLSKSGPERLSAQQRLGLLRAAGASGRPGQSRPRASSKLKKAIKSVLALPELDLERLLDRIVVIGGDEASRPSREKLAAQFGIPQESDSDFVLMQLLGWLVTGAATAWREGRPAWFSRAACLKVCDTALRRAAQRRFLPRPSREVTVSDRDRERARSRGFVELLVQIDAESEDVEQAIDHFVQFGIERHRLLDEGEVPPNEWVDRGDRLVTRWRNISRQAIRRMSGQSPVRFVDQCTCSSSTSLRRAGLTTPRLRKNCSSSQDG